MSDPTDKPPVTTGTVERWLVAANGAVLIALMAGMALLVIANVFARYVFNNSFVWAEELSRYMMIWVGFLGSGFVLRVGAHIAAAPCPGRLPRRCVLRPAARTRSRGSRPRSSCSATAPRPRRRSG